MHCMIWNGLLSFPPPRRNYYTRLQCDTLKLAMIKNKHLAQSLFRGDVYDCVCRFDEVGG